MSEFNRRSFCALAVASLLTVAGCGGPTMITTGANVQKLTEPVPELDAAVTNFGGRLLAALGTESNLVCSPLSIMMVMAMVRNGAEGSTAAEIDQALGLPEPAVLNRGLAYLRQQLPELGGKIEQGRRSGEISVDLANQIFARPEIPWTTPYLDLLAQWYDTGIAEADFTDPERAAKLINDWVADQTRDKIENLVQPDNIDADTAIALVNALYFAAPWSQVFAEAGPMPFTTAAGEQVQAPMLSAQGYWDAAVADGWTAVSVPYLGGDFAMTVAQSDLGRESEMLQAFADGGIVEALRAQESTAVDLTMPQWTADSRFDLKDVLGALGIVTAFDPEAAQFDPMTGGAIPIWLQTVLHRGWIVVDAEGTEAAAATAAMQGAGSAAPPDGPIEMILDRPFAWAITHVATGACLLTGWVADPTAG